MNIKYEIKKISKIYNIEAPNIIFNEYLAFSYSNMTLYLKKIEDEKLLFLSFHEFRHYMQDLYIKKHNDIKAKRYKYEMDNYNNLNYLDLEIEIDAYAFSYMILKKYYNIDYKLNDLIKDKILNYIDNEVI